MKHTQFRSCISNKIYAMNTQKYRQEIVTSLIVICGFTGLNTEQSEYAFFIYFCHELFFAWDQLPQIQLDVTRYSRFFPVRKGARKNTKQQQKRKTGQISFTLDMFHGVKMCSLLISRRESLHRLNNHGVEVFTDLSQHDQFHAKSEKFSQGVNGRGI